MKERFWPRSRFWLCYFLNNRHRRAPINWAAASTMDGPARRNFANLLLRASAALGCDHRWLVEQALHDCAEDPAYIQCLRLFAKEEHFLESLRQRLGDDPRGKASTRWPERLTLPLRRALGLRFELSVQLLAELVDLAFCELVGQTRLDGALGPACRQIENDRRAHAAFHAERLTQEFADFNFVRRNLRRWRLRVLFGALMVWSALRHGGAIRAAGWTRRQLFIRSWASFSEVLERMVPYHRDALLATLLQQRDRPYGNPLHWE